MNADRCGNPRCRTSIDLDWNADVCPCGDVATCRGCDPVDVCEECRWAIPADPFAPEDHETFDEVVNVPDLRAGDRAYHAAQAETLRRLAARRDAS